MELFQKKRLLQAMVIATAASLAACGGDDGSNGDTGADGVNGSPAFMKFVGVAAPATDAEKREITVSQAIVNGKIYAGEYNVLARSGDVISGVAFGQLVNKAGTVLTEDDGSVRISDSNEFTSLLPIGNKLYSVSQFEDRPGAMFLMELNQDKDNGKLSVANLTQIDQSGIDGGWVHCAGSVTPWTTHLASEEYEPDAKKQPTSAEAALSSYSASMLDYYAEASEWNPYFYGWNIEVTVAENAAVTTEKHYAMGRLAYELAYVMPDSKTTYMTDDGTNVGLYMFVADTAGDLSAGTTYAAKWNQTDSTGIGAADLTWISLGHATNAEISDYVHGTNGKTKVTFNDIFDSEDPVGNACSAGFTSINANGVGQECLKVKAGMEKVASRLETRRYAAMLGATTEFRKEEGITYDSKRHKMYVGMSNVTKGMLAGTSGDVGGPDHIQLDEENKCGAVYQMDLGPDSAIGSNYVAHNMYGLVAGRPVSIADPQVAGFEAKNSCHIDGIAEPDNVTYISGYDMLIIGEDAGTTHQNDALWAYDFASEKKLTRILTTPYGSETTSPYWYPNINGWSYLTTVVQHPYVETDDDKDTGSGEARAYTGYVGPFPAVNVQ
ncbi:PhoX family protein [Thalassolituus hydrocarboniclasticus]|uniref:DUF839 domain-containing protein n=1 Tax=Thalassolituus hydrocarboniclasticus TaxID=2742796 RepID=A0ABY6ABZ8_9GAMM|nr:alkaline phosphatase PhoX [Thalassolituus hydrocarboniclasticus]UXD88551.1 DUF839 domain-containing protein [Thalassolituus hydrocarboniclasticus]